MTTELTLLILDSESCPIDRGVGLESDGGVITGRQNGGGVWLPATKLT